MQEVTPKIGSKGMSLNKFKSAAPEVTQKIGHC